MYRVQIFLSIVITSSTNISSQEFLALKNKINKFLYISEEKKKVAIYLYFPFRITDVLIAIILFLWEKA